MLDINMINEEIKKLEECECPTWTVCQRLASLYIIKDHHAAAPMKSMATPMHQGASENHTSVPQTQQMGKI